MLPQFQRQCFDFYVVHLELMKPVTGSERLGLIESNWIIPSVNVNGSFKLNVTTNSTLSANMFYNATVITTINMMMAGNIQFCKCTICNMNVGVSQKQNCIGLAYRYLHPSAYVSMYAVARGLWGRASPGRYFAVRWLLRLFWGPKTYYYSLL